MHDKILLTDSLIGLRDTNMQFIDLNLQVRNMWQHLYLFMRLLAQHAAIIYYKR